MEVVKQTFRLYVGYVRVGVITLVTSLVVMFIASYVRLHPEHGVVGLAVVSAVWSVLGFSSHKGDRSPRQKSEYIFLALSISIAVFSVVAVFTSRALFYRMDVSAQADHIRARAIQMPQRRRPVPSTNTIQEPSSPMLAVPDTHPTAPPRARPQPRESSRVIHADKVAVKVEGCFRILDAVVCEVALRNTVEEPILIGLVADPSASENSVALSESGEWRWQAETAAIGELHNNHPVFLVQGHNTVGAAVIFPAVTSNVHSFKTLRLVIVIGDKQRVIKFRDVPIAA